MVTARVLWSLSQALTLRWDLLFLNDLNGSLSLVPLDDALMCSNFGLGLQVAS